MTLTEFIKADNDRYNPSKVWLVKRYADGHYGLNQEIAGRIFYPAYQRTTREHIEQILAG